MILPTKPLVDWYPALTADPSHVCVGLIVLMQIIWVVADLDAYIRHGQPSDLHLAVTR